MKLTANQLRQIIKEEASRVLLEDGEPGIDPSWQERSKELLQNLGSVIAKVKSEDHLGEINQLLTHLRNAIANNADLAKGIMALRDAK